MLEFILVLLLCVTFVLFSAKAYRWRGMNRDDVPAILEIRLVRRLLCSFLIGFAMILPVWEYAVLTPILWTLVVASAGLSFFGIITGHGSYFPRADNAPLNVDNEFFKKITKFVANPLTEKGRQFGMMLTGLSSTIPVGLAMLCVLYYIYGIVFPYTIIYALWGIVKAVIYWNTDNTEDAEFVWGGAMVLPPVIEFLIRYIT